MAKPRKKVPTLIDFIKRSRPRLVANTQVHQPTRQKLRDDAEKRASKEDKNQ